MLAIVQRDGAQGSRRARQVTGRTDELVSRTMVAGEIIRDTFRVKLDRFGNNTLKAARDAEEQDAVV